MKIGSSWSSRERFNGNGISARCCFLELPNPDVAVANWIAVVLENQRAFGCKAGEFGGGGRLALHRNMVLNQDSVMENREGSWEDGFSVGRLLGCVKDDVVGLPFTRLARGVHQGGCVVVEGTRLAVEVGLVVVGVENLDFVAALEVNSTVAPALAVAFDFSGSGPFDMKLAITEFLASDNAASRIHFHRAIC